MTENAVEARVWIDDILLQDLGITVLLNSEEPALPAMRNFNVTIPGKHGALDLGAYLEPRQFELNCVFARQSYTELKRSILELNTLLVDENGHPKTVKLRFGDDEHKWFIVRLTDGIPMDRIAERGFCTIVLTAYDPFAYAPATYYDPDVVGDYAESVHRWEFGGEKRGVNLAPIKGGSFIDYQLNPRDVGEVLNPSEIKIYKSDRGGNGYLFDFAKVSQGIEYVIQADLTDMISTFAGVVVYDKNKQIIEQGGLLSGDITWVTSYRGYQVHSEGIVPMPLKFKVIDSRVKYVRLRIGVYRAPSTDRDVIIKNPALSEGTMSKWSPALEDSLIRNPMLNGQVGGRNYFVIKDAKEDTLLVWATGKESGGKGSLTSGFIPANAREDFICNESISQLLYYDAKKEHIPTSNMIPGYSFKIANTPEIKYIRITFRNNFLNGRKKEEVRVKLEKGVNSTPWTPSPEDSGWQFSQTIEGDFYGDGETNDKLIWINSMPYKESWWYFAGERLLKRDKPELIKVRSRGAIYLKEGINTINVSDENNMLDTVDMTYQHGTVKLSRGDNIIDSPQLEYSKYGADLEYTNQVYSPFLNTRQYVGVFNYSHYATPFNFVIEGYCKNPKIINQTTGKYIQFNLTVQKDERLYIDSRRLTTWKIKIKDDQYEYLTPHKIMRDYEAWDKINAYNESEGDFVMLSSGENHWRFESDDTPDAKIYLDWEHRFL